MKTLYLNLSMGAAGDMLGAALIELLPDPDAFVEKLNLLSIPGVVYSRERTVKCGILGSHLTVKVNGLEELPGSVPSEDTGHHHHHHSYKDIENIVNNIPNLKKSVKEDILSVYMLIARAESEVHGKPVEEIHFHEVGAMDAIADITAVCLLFDTLSLDEVIASPIHVGSGQIQCAHGILPVPAPATARILCGVPMYGGAIQGELCTPTGAALLRHFVTRFGDMPPMSVSAIGYGMGKKDFGTANCICAMLGHTEGSQGDIVELSCNVDDMTGEKISFAMDRFFESGALDVYTIPINMKKSRPGTLIRVMCEKENVENLVHQIFKYTSTIGIREQAMHRYTLQRSIDPVETSFGTIRRKTVSGYNVSRGKWEYEDISRIAKENGLSPFDVEKTVDKEI